MLYIKETLYSFLKITYATVSCKNFSAEIKVAHATLLALVYRNIPTLAEHDAQICKKMKDKVLNHHETIIFGDFNLLYIDRVRQASQTTGNNLTKWIVNNSNDQYVRKPTEGITHKN